MRSLERNKQTFYYALYKGEVEETEFDDPTMYTGERTPTYESPVQMRANISAARGDSEWTPFGVNTDYSKTIVTTDMSCPMNEDTILWIGIPTTEPHNYVVTRVAKSINSITYAIKEVNVGSIDED